MNLLYFDRGELWSPSIQEVIEDQENDKQEEIISVNKSQHGKVGELLNFTVLEASSNAKFGIRIMPE